MVKNGEDNTDYKNLDHTFTYTTCANLDVAPLKQRLTFVLNIFFLSKVHSHFCKYSFKATFIFSCRFYKLSDDFFLRRTNYSFVKETNISGCGQPSEDSPEAILRISS